MPHYSGGNQPGGTHAAAVTGLPGSLGWAGSQNCPGTR